jgi:hypothetical protein
LTRENSQFDNFDRMMHELIKVSHSEIKEKLDAEKAEKKKRRKAKKPSASGRADGEKD